MKLEVDRKACLKSGQCTYMHPRLFKQGEDLFPIVIVDEVPEELAEEAEDAADICPASAISVVN